MSDYNSTKVNRSRYVQGGDTDKYPTRLGWWDRRILPKSDTDVSITIDKKYQFKPWLVAYDYLGSESLEWVVLQYNNVLDVMEDFKIGTVIWLPTPQRLNLEILSKPAGGKVVSES